MDLERIEELIQIIKEAGVTEISVRRDGSAVVMRKSPQREGHVVSAPVSRAQTEGGAPPEHSPEAETPEGAIISAPMVGIFHTIDAIAARGAVVRKGQVVGAIESMKLMNEIVSTAEGIVAEVCVEDGTPVEYGHALFRLETPGNAE